MENETDFILRFIINNTVISTTYGNSFKLADNNILAVYKNGCIVATYGNVNNIIMIGEINGCMYYDVIINL